MAHDLKGIATNMHSYTAFRTKWRGLQKISPYNPILSHVAYHLILWGHNSFLCHDRSTHIIHHPTMRGDGFFKSPPHWQVCHIVVVQSIEDSRFTQFCHDARGTFEKPHDTSKESETNKYSISMSLHDRIMK